MYTVISKTIYCPMFNTKKDPKSINLLQSETDSQGILYTSVNWFASVGKTFLIIVQVIALAVFVFRLVMDGKNNDLTGEINAQVKVLENDTWKQSAIKYENLQNLLADVKIIGTEQKINSNVISEVLGSIPVSLNVESMSINNDRVSIAIKTTDFLALKNYEDALKNNTYYSDVRFNISKTNDELEVSVTFIVNEEVT